MYFRLHSAIQTPKSVTDYNSRPVQTLRTISKHPKVEGFRKHVSIFCNGGQKSTIWMHRPSSSSLTDWLFHATRGFFQACWLVFPCTAAGFPHWPPAIWFHTNQRVWKNAPGVRITCGKTWSDVHWRPPQIFLRFHQPARENRKCRNGWWSENFM